MYNKNRQKYFNKVDDNSLSLFYSGQMIQRSADQDYDFEVDKNFYYLTGISQENVILMLVKSANTNRSILFIDENDPVLVKWVGKKLTKDEAKAISNVDEVRYISQFDKTLFLFLNPSRVSATIFSEIYLNLERRSEEKYTNWAIEYAKKLKETYPDVTIKNSYNVVVALRMIKEQYEIDSIKASIDVTKLGIETLMRESVPGLYEYQLENYFDFCLKHNNQRTTSFKTIAASGVNATILHYVDNNSLLKDNDLILFDLGSRDKDYYISDISRTFPVNGKFTPRQREVYQAVLDVNKQCIEYLKPGLTWNEYNMYAKNLLAAACKKLGLITNEADVVNYYWHSIGHSIGLDTHDPCISTLPLTEGMVLTVEPGLYIEDEQIGVRIEDNVLITDKGAINLSRDIIKEIDDIEAFMKKKSS